MRSISWLSFVVRVKILDRISFTENTSELETGQLQPHRRHGVAQNALRKYQSHR